MCRKDRVGCVGMNYGYMVKAHLYWKSSFHSRDKRIVQIVLFVLQVQKRSQTFRMKSKQLILKDNESAKHDMHPAVCPGQNSSWSTLSRVSEPILHVFMFRFPSPGDPAGHLIVHLHSCPRSPEFPGTPMWMIQLETSSKESWGDTATTGMIYLYLLAEAFMMGIRFYDFPILSPGIHAIFKHILNEQMCCHLLIWRVWLVAVPKDDPGVW